MCLRCIINLQIKKKKSNLKKTFIYKYKHGKRLVNRTKNVISLAHKLHFNLKTNFQILLPPRRKWNKKIWKILVQIMKMPLSVYNKKTAQFHCDLKKTLLTHKDQIQIGISQTLSLLSSRFECSFLNITNKLLLASWDCCVYFTHYKEQR